MNFIQIVIMISVCLKFNRYDNHGRCLMICLGVFFSCLFQLFFHIFFFVVLLFYYYRRETNVVEQHSPRANLRMFWKMSANPSIPLMLLKRHFGMRLTNGGRDLSTSRRGAVLTANVPCELRICFCLLGPYFTRQRCIIIPLESLFYLLWLRRFCCLLVLLVSRMTWQTQRRWMESQTTVAYLILFCWDTYMRLIGIAWHHFYASIPINVCHYREFCFFASFAQRLHSFSSASFSSVFDSFWLSDLLQLIDCHSTIFSDINFFLLLLLFRCNICIWIFQIDFTIILNSILNYITDVANWLRLLHFLHYYLICNSFCIRFIFDSFIELRIGWIGARIARSNFK